MTGAEPDGSKPKGVTTNLGLGKDTRLWVDYMTGWYIASLLVYIGTFFFFFFFYISLKTRSWGDGRGVSGLGPVSDR